MIDLDWGWPTERLDLEPLAMAHAGELPPLLDDVSLHEFTGGAPSRQLVTDLSRAQIAPAEGRDEEVDCRHGWERARRRAILSENSPKVTRGGYTTAEPDAWTDDEVCDLRFDYDKAVVMREASQDRLRVLLATAEIPRSLAASVRAAFEMAGSTG